jgi:hypothetical protein
MKPCDRPIATQLRFQCLAMLPTAHLQVHGLHVGVEQAQVLAQLRLRLVGVLCALL